VQVVIVAWNSGEHLQRAVDGLAAQDFRDFEAVVWDNASSDGAVDRLSLPANTRVVKHAENLGFAAGVNRAAALSRSAYIATLNPDAVPAPNWLATLVAAAERHGAEAVASLQLDAADPDRLDGAGDVFSVSGFAWRGGYGHAAADAPREPVEVFTACAAAALYRRDAFEALGGFDERYFCYFEDVDLGARLRARGGRVVLEPRAVVRHVGSASSDTISGFAEYHGTRNRLWTLAKTMPAALLPLAVPLYVAFSLYVLARSPELRAPRWRAIKDALRGLRPYLAERRQWRPRSLADYLRAVSWDPLAVRTKRLVYRRLE
jgi:GT2 family glycosyltransferase